MELKGYKSALVMTGFPLSIFVKSFSAFAQIILIQKDTWIWNFQKSIYFLPESTFMLIPVFSFQTKELLLI